MSGGRPHWLWWLYFALYVTMFVWGGYLLLASFPATYPQNMLAVVSTILDVLGICCLYFFLRSKPVVSPTFWKTFTALYFCKMAFALSIFLRVLLTFGWAGDTESYVTLLGIVGVLLGLPALAAFWLYAFRSAAMWARQ
jgi:hypothetical protein